MEINPRLQVEHTITESLCNLDLVCLQLLIAQGRTLSNLGISFPLSSEPPPVGAAIQLRVTAEDVRRNFSPSIGRINAVSLPGGNGVRIDTYLKPGVIVSHDFDSLLAKIILTSSDRHVAIRKGIRALEDLQVEGITTNIDLLRGILSAEDFYSGQCNLQWLEDNLDSIIDLGESQRRKSIGSTGVANEAIEKPHAISGGSSSSSGFSFRKGDSWNMSLANSTSTAPEQLVVQISRLLRNDFPSNLIAEVSVSSNDHDADKSSLQDLKIELSQSTFSTNSSSITRGDRSNPAHLACPFSGQLVETLVNEDDNVDTYDAIAVVRQMKMEVEIRAHKPGVVKRLWDIEPGSGVQDGLLVCEICDEQRLREKL